MVLVARQAATNRPIRLLSDLLDNRGEVLEKGELSYQVLVPPAEGAVGCSVRRRWAAPKRGSSSICADPTAARSRSIAGRTRTRRSEICDLPEGQYEARLGLSGERPGAVLLSMFESTPGRLSAEDVKAASLGLPTMPRRGEVLRLDGSGTVAFKGTAGKLVVGKVGDRDGDPHRRRRRSLSLRARGQERLPRRRRLSRRSASGDQRSGASRGRGGSLGRRNSVGNAERCARARLGGPIARSPLSGDDKQSKKKSKKTVVFVP